MSSCRNTGDRTTQEKLIECARRELDPGKSLRNHLRSCDSCSEVWEEQEFLTANLKAIRESAWDLRSPAENRDLLMRQFAARRRAHVAPRWYWGLAAAAAVVVAVTAIPGLSVPLLRHSAPAAVAAATVSNAEEAGEIRADSPAEDEADGFIAVPFVPPLATGEMVRVVHTDLDPAALASLGVSVDPAWNTRLPADVLLGEDGMPRAVRVSDDSLAGTGF